MPRPWLLSLKGGEPRSGNETIMTIILLCHPFLFLVPTASRLPLQGSNLQPQHSLGSHSSQASPDITTTSIDTTTVPQPSGTYMSRPHYSSFLSWCHDLLSHLERLCYRPSDCIVCVQTDTCMWVMRDS